MLRNSSSFLRQLISLCKYSISFSFTLRRTWEKNNKTTQCGCHLMPKRKKWKKTTNTEHLFITPNPYNYHLSPPIMHSNCVLADLWQTQWAFSVIYIVHNLLFIMTFPLWSENYNNQKEHKWTELVYFWHWCSSRSHRSWSVSLIKCPWAKLYNSNRSAILSRALPSSCANTYRDTNSVSHVLHVYVIQPPILLNLWLS